MASESQATPSPADQDPPTPYPPPPYSGYESDLFDQEKIGLHALQMIFLLPLLLLRNIHKLSAIVDTDLFYLYQQVISSLSWIVPWIYWITTNEIFEGFYSFFQPLSIKFILSAFLYYYFLSLRDIKTEKREMFTLTSML